MIKASGEASELSIALPVAPLARSRLIRFLAVGAIGLGVDTLVYSLAAGAGAGDAIARALSLGIATVVTWRLNRWITFGASGRRPAYEAARYAAVALGAQGFNWTLFLGLRTAFPAWPAPLAILASAVAAATFSFLGQRTITFAPPVSAVRSGR